MFQDFQTLTSSVFEQAESEDNSSEVGSNQGHGREEEVEHIQNNAERVAENHPFDSNAENNNNQDFSEVSPSHVPLTLTRISNSSSSPRSEHSRNTTSPLPGIEEVVRNNSSPGVVNETFEDDETERKN